MNWSHRSLACLVSGSLFLAPILAGCAVETAPSSAPAANVAAPPAVTPTAPAGQQSADELDQLVAPIALYPDALVAQIVAASTNATEIVEADRWLQQHARLKETALARAVNAQSWDLSVKALVQFPSVLHNMNQNLAWTSALPTRASRTPCSTRSR
jgi:hypothetical protein